MLVAHADLTTRGACERLLQRPGRLVGIDVWVNNAGSTCDS